MSQEIFAEYIGTSRVYISNIERGKSAPSLEMFINIVNALNISADDLLEGNLIALNAGSREEEMDILFDCSQEECRILLESIRVLKQVIRGYNITK